jgi:hypothetical protein
LTKKKDKLHQLQSQGFSRRNFVAERKSFDIQEKRKSLARYFSAGGAHDADLPAVPP